MSKAKKKNTKQNKTTNKQTNKTKKKNQNEAVITLLCNLFSIVNVCFIQAGRNALRIVCH